MDPRSVNQFLEKIGELKSLDRQGWVLRNLNKPETVAGHMYRMAIIALLVFDENVEKDIDFNKVIKLALIHDAAECIVGDITPYDGVSPEDKKKREIDAIDDLSKLLPNNSANLLKNLFDEYETRESKEAKLVKEIDIFDLVLQAHEYEKRENNNKRSEIIDLEHFFDPERTLKYIQHPILKSLLNKMLEDRKEFLSKLNNNCNINDKNV